MENSRTTPTPREIMIRRRRNRDGTRARMAEANARDNAARIIARNLRNNIIGTYNGVGLVVRIKINPSKQDRETGVVSGGDFRGSRIERVFDIDLEGAGLRYVARVVNHPRFSRRTITASANSTRQLFRKLQAGREKWIRDIEEESPVYDVVQRPIGVRAVGATQIRPRSTSGSVLSRPMLRAGCVDIDTFVTNAEWCRNDGKCCVDYLQHHYGGTKGMKKKLTDAAIQEAAGTEPWAEPNTHGYSILHMAAIAKKWGVSIIAIEDGRIVYNKVDENPSNKKKAMVFAIRNQHLYPIFETKEIKKWSERAKVGSMKIWKLVEEKEEAERVHFGTVNTDWGLTSPEASIMKWCKDKNKQPVGSITKNGNSVTSMTFEGKVYKFGEEDHEVNGMSAQKYIQDCDLWKSIPNSYFNPEVRAALGKKNVKHRVHYGVVRDNLAKAYLEISADAHNPEDRQHPNREINKRTKTFDINKHYRDAMQHPADDWMTIGIGARVEKRNVFNNDFGLWFVETHDLTVLHGTNWYSSAIVSFAIKMAVPDVQVRYFIEGERNGRTCLKELINSIDKNAPENNKLAVNMLSGIIGKTQSKRTNLEMTTDEIRVLQKLSEYKTPEIHQFEDVFLVGNKRVTELLANKLPMYIQILDTANMRLAQHIHEIGGLLLHRKTDSFSIFDPQFIQVSNRVGGYKAEPKEIDTINPRYEATTESRSVNFEMKNYDIDTSETLRDSEDHDEIYKRYKRKMGLLLEGRGGTGKTWVGKKIAKMLIADGKRVLMMSFTNKACLNWIEFDGKTIHKTFSINENTGKYDEKKMREIMKHFDTIIIDEISMIPKKLWEIIYQLKVSSGLPMILIGDKGQLRPPDNSNFRIFNSPLLGFLSNYNGVELTVVKRYDEKLRLYTEEFRGGECSGLEPAKDACYSSEGTGLCYYNKTRKAVNAARNMNVKGVKVEIDDNSPEEAQTAVLAHGIPVIANVTNKKIDIAKNETLYVETIADESITYKRGRDGEFVTDDVKNFHKHFLLGYCMTIHKAQGDTIEGRVNIFDWELVQNENELAYTSTSRATAFDNIHVQAKN